MGVQSAAAFTAERPASPRPGQALQPCQVLTGHPSEVPAALREYGCAGHLRSVQLCSPLPPQNLIPSQYLAPQTPSPSACGEPASILLQGKPSPRPAQDGARRQGAAATAPPQPVRGRQRQQDKRGFPVPPTVRATRPAQPPGEEGRNRDWGTQMLGPFPWGRSLATEKGETGEWRRPARLTSKQ